MALGQHGAHGNLWRDTKADTDDAATERFDMGYGNEAHIFGSAEGAYLVQVQYSQDGTNWYNGENAEPDEDSDFNIKLSGVQARYVRLRALRGPDFAAGDSSDEREPMDLTATLVAKTIR